MTNELLDKIICDVDTRNPNAFFAMTAKDSADLLIGGRQTSCILLGYLKRGDETIFRNCSRNFSSGSNVEEFTIIASKRKKDLGADFILFNEIGNIIFSSNEKSEEDITGFFYIGFSDEHGSFSLLLSVFIESNGLNTSNLIIDGDAEHRDSLCRLACFAYRGGKENE